MGHCSRTASCRSFVGEAAKNDKEVVLATVRRNGRSFAGDSCKNDKEIALAAVRQHSER